MTRTIAPLFAVLFLSACTSMNGPGDLFTSVQPQVSSVSDAALPTPHGLATADGASSSIDLNNLPNAPLTPGRIAAPISDAQGEAIEDPAYGQTTSNVAITSRPLGDLPRRADGTMILPPVQRLDVIDIKPIRDGLALPSELSVASPSAASDTVSTQ